MNATRVLFVMLFGLLALNPAPGVADDILYLEQGWGREDRETMYHIPQGSLIMPFAWFQALEQADSEALVRDDKFIASFGYLPEAKNASNPDALPVGFAKAPFGPGNKELWIGMTCAACHTGQVTYKGKTVRVDGGTTLADILGFQSALVASLKATVRQPAKFQRFALRVLGADHKPEQSRQLAALLRKHFHEMARWEATSQQAHPGGPGVWDALGVLLNTVTGSAPGTPDNYRVPQTPVSYPSIWETNQYNRLLWNASVENVTLRQVGEVIIVFGRAKAVVEPSGKMTFDSSADLKELQRVYEFTSVLTPPEWPENVLGKIDRNLAKRGAEVYRQQNCASCHPLRPYPTVQAKPGGRKLIKVTATPIREVDTDSFYAEYFVQRTSVPGPLLPMFKGTIFEGERQVPAAIQFLATLTQITEAGIEKAAKTPQERESLLGGRPLPQLPKTKDELNELIKGLLVYKATPLAGIWATAPYLHNGSVPNLYELLLPPEKRTKTFYLGDREFDPKHIGYRTAEFEGGYMYDTSLPGYSNRGHTYGTTIGDEDRWALVEFLKTL